MTFLIVALQCRFPRPNMHYYFNYLNILKLLDFLHRPLHTPLEKGTCYV